MCRKVPESLAHVLAGCSSLAQIKYMDRYIAALKVLFFEMLRDLKLANSFPPWYSRVEPKPMYESTDAQVFWDVPVYAEHTSFCLSQQGGCTSCRAQSEEGASCGNELPLVGQPRKEEKYEPLRWEFTKRYPGYKIVQLNIIMDILGGWSKELEVKMNKTFGAQSSDVLKRIQNCPAP